MTAIIVDGKKIAEEILGNLRLQISDLGVKPKLVVFLIGQNPSSLVYIKKKQEAGEEIGIEVKVKNYPQTIIQSELQQEIRKFNQEPQVHGILVQLPLPQHLDGQAVLDTIFPELDVDCLTTINKQKLIKGEKVFLPPAAAAVFKILEFYKINLAKANILIVGSGELVGKPLAAILLNRKINFELANRYTENLPKLARKADVIITGVGKPGLITAEMIKEGAVVIDAGTAVSETGRELRGDVDIESVLPKSKLLSPVPGGVGPVTVAMLLQNVVDSAFDPVRQ